MSLDSLYNLAATYPLVAPPVIFLAAVLAHVVVGVLVHLIRRRDFDWHALGAFVEQDMATTRAKVIAIAFLSGLAVVVLVPSSSAADLKAATLPVFATLAAACTAATLPILRDTVYSLIELVSGSRPLMATSTPATGGSMSMALPKATLPAGTITLPGPIHVDPGTVVAGSVPVIQVTATPPIDEAALADQMIGKLVDRLTQPNA